MSAFTHLLFHHFQFALIHGPNIPGSYAILLFTASDLASMTSHIHNWVLFLLWLRLFILSGVVSPLISSSILGTYWPGEFIFQCPIFLPFHTVHGVLKARILKWFAIPFSSGPHSVICHNVVIRTTFPNLIKKTKNRQTKMSKFLHAQAIWRNLGQYQQPTSIRVWVIVITKLGNEGQEICSISPWLPHILELT